MLIEVEQQDIDNAGDGALDCPVARAMIRKGLEFVTVTPKYLIFSTSNEKYKENTTVKVRDKINKWDYVRTMSPFSFKLPIPEKEI
jgi:hypothetical protein